MNKDMAVYLDDKLSRYGFGSGHPFSTERYFAFKEAMLVQRLDEKVIIAKGPRATVDDLLLFHDKFYVKFVEAMSGKGFGLLDDGDTPAFNGLFEIACDVVGATLDATARIMTGEFRRAFVPIAGLHHAYRNHAAGFCVFNDIGVAIAALRRRHQVKTIAYVDIDVHHGDGVFYGYVEDADLIFADIHEDGNYPGTGSVDEIGLHQAKGRKLNIPLPYGATDADFLHAFLKVTAFVDHFAPEFIILQCGADSLKNDLLGGFQFSAHAHAHAANTLRSLADKHAKGRLLALGGGGYNLKNIAAAWTGVVAELI